MRIFLRAVGKPNIVKKSLLDSKFPSIILLNEILGNRGRSLFLLIETKWPSFRQWICPSIFRQRLGSTMHSLETRFPFPSGTTEPRQDIQNEIIISDHNDLLDFMRLAFWIRRMINSKWEFKKSRIFYEHKAGGKRYNIIFSRIRATRYHHAYRQKQHTPSSMCVNYDRVKIKGGRGK